MASWSGKGSRSETISQVLINHQLGLLSNIKLMGRGGRGGGYIGGRSQGHIGSLRHHPQYGGGGPNLGGIGLEDQMDGLANNVTGPKLLNGYYSLTGSQ